MNKFYLRVVFLKLTVLYQIVKLLHRPIKLTHRHRHSTSFCQPLKAIDTQHAAVSFEHIKHASSNNTPLFSSDVKVVKTSSRVRGRPTVNQRIELSVHFVVCLVLTTSSCARRVDLLITFGFHCCHARLLPLAFLATLPETSESDRFSSEDGDVTPVNEEATGESLKLVFAKTPLCRTLPASCGIFESPVNFDLGGKLRCSNCTRDQSNVRCGSLVKQLCPTEMICWANNYVTIYMRAAH